MIEDRRHAEYLALCERVGLVDRSRRGLIELRGRDRAAWLNNLVTNAVKSLRAGEGRYAFAVNLKGRVVFDANLLALEDAQTADGRMWLDLDRGWIGAALRHLEKYVITEDVKLADASGGYARWGIAGPRSAVVVAALGLGDLTAMAALQHAELTGGGRWLRHDFLGPAGAEFIVPATEREAWRGRLLEAGRGAGIAEVSDAASEIVRIECGIPASGFEIDGEVIPPETLQTERAIDYHKGCYLGQEVIERMRSHGVLARRLAGFRISASAVTCPSPPPPLTLHAEGHEVGRVTSCCWSPAAGGPLGLGYAKVGHATVGTRLRARASDGTEYDACVVRLPVPKQACGEGG